MKKREKQQVGLNPGDVRRALIMRGQLIPQTEAEVKLFEESVDIDRMALPDGLADPFSIPTDVEERMRRDRRAAEADDGDDEQDLAG